MAEEIQKPVAMVAQEVSDHNLRQVIAQVLPVIGAMERLP
jgi:hypothetical protein